MHIFNIFVRYLQSAEKIHYLGIDMHYQPLFTRCSCRKNGLVKNPVSLSKNLFSASNFFMHIFIMSVAYLQNAEKIQ